MQTPGGAVAHFHLGRFVSSHKMNFMEHRPRVEEGHTGPEQRSSAPGVETGIKDREPALLCVGKEL